MGHDQFRGKYLFSKKKIDIKFSRELEKLNKHQIASNLLRVGSEQQQRAKKK